MNALSRQISGMVATLWISAASAQESVKDAPSSAESLASPELFSAGYLFQVIGSLLLVFVCLFAVVYFLKRFNGVGAGHGSALRVLASANVGPREKVVLLEVGEEQLLIGVAPGAVRNIHVLKAPLAAASSEGSTTPDFASVLRSANPLVGRS